MTATPAAPPAAPSGTREVLALADGVELIGEFEGSGFREPPLLARRGDGQMVTAHAGCCTTWRPSCDGRRDAEQVAAVVLRALRARRQRAQRPPARRGAAAPARRARARRRDDARAAQARRRCSRCATAGRSSPSGPSTCSPRAFAWLHAQPLKAVLLAGARCCSTPGCSASTASRAGIRTVLYEPALAAGPARARSSPRPPSTRSATPAPAAIGGARPGEMGVGVYLIWPAFYCDVTEAYRLNRRGRLRTDLGGVYFNGLFALMAGAAYFATGAGGAAVRRLRAAPDRPAAAAAAAALRRLLRAQRPHRRAGHPLAHQADLPLARARPPQGAAGGRAQAVGALRGHGLPARARTAAGAADRLDRDRGAPDVRDRLRLVLAPARPPARLATAPPSSASARSASPPWSCRWRRCR